MTVYSKRKSREKLRERKITSHCLEQGHDGVSFFPSFIFLLPTGAIGVGNTAIRMGWILKKKKNGLKKARMLSEQVTIRTGDLEREDLGKSR